ncbi:unnamed protein product [Peniophora sp. CBMAI 1063]|nr:unnamed protein product [Peniophora sp. CBMAI 1063]
MWTIQDVDAPESVAAYYKKLLEMRKAGVVAKRQTGAVYALHEAPSRHTKPTSFNLNSTSITPHILSEPSIVPSTGRMSKPNGRSPSPSKHGEHLPPKKPREERGIIADVHPPFYNVSFATFMNLLGAGLIVVLAVYSYAAAQDALGLARGSNSGALHPALWILSWGGGSSASTPSASASAKVDNTDMAVGVESHIAGLASVLGMGQDSDLATALAEVVREHVPPASLSALAAQAESTGGSRVVDALLGKEPEATGVAKVADTLGTVVGTDDAPEALG